MQKIKTEFGEKSVFFDQTYNLRFKRRITIFDVKAREIFFNPKNDYVYFYDLEQNKTRRLPVDRIYEIERPYDKVVKELVCFIKPDHPYGFNMGDNCKSGKNEFYNLMIEYLNRNWLARKVKMSDYGEAKNAWESACDMARYHMLNATNDIIELLPESAVFEDEIFKTVRKRFVDKFYDLMLSDSWDTELFRRRACRLFQDMVRTMRKEGNNEQ